MEEEQEGVVVTIPGVGSYRYREVVTDDVGVWARWARAVRLLEETAKAKEDCKPEGSSDLQSDPPLTR